MAQATPTHQLTLEDFAPDSPGEATAYFDPIGTAAALHAVVEAHDELDSAFRFLSNAIADKSASTSAELATRATVFIGQAHDHAHEAVEIFMAMGIEAPESDV